MACYGLWSSLLLAKNHGFLYRAVSLPDTLDLALLQKPRWKHWGIGGNILMDIGIYKVIISKVVINETFLY